MLRLKTQAEVERDFARFMEEGPVGRAIEGRVYRMGTRPDGAAGEDCVVKMIAGEDSLLQTGVVACDIYVADVPAPGVRGLAPDLRRIAELQRAVMDFIDGWECEDGYQIRTDGSMTVERAEGVAQHYVYARLRFHRRAS